MHWLATNTCSICERPLHPGKGTCQACRTDPVASLRAVLKETREELTRLRDREEPTVSDQNKDMDPTSNTRPVPVKDVIYRLAADMVLARLIVAADEAVLAYADLQLARNRRWQSCLKLREEEQALAVKAANGGSRVAVEAWQAKFVEMRRADADALKDHANLDPRHRAEEALGNATRAVQDHLLATYLRGDLREQLQ